MRSHFLSTAQGLVSTLEIAPSPWGTRLCPPVTRTPSRSTDIAGFRRLEHPDALIVSQRAKRGPELHDAAISAFEEKAILD
jgi:hypothetical protein